MHKIVRLALFVRKSLTLKPVLLALRCFLAIFVFFIKTLGFKTLIDTLNQFHAGSIFDTLD
jgi:hypothetical protein